MPQPVAGLLVLALLASIACASPLAPSPPAPLPPGYTWIATPGCAPGSLSTPTTLPDGQLDKADGSTVLVWWLNAPEVSPYHFLVAQFTPITATLRGLCAWQIVTDSVKAA